MSTKVLGKKSLSADLRVLITETIQDILEDSDFGLSLTDKAKKRLRASKYSHKLITLSEIKEKYTQTPWSLYFTLLAAKDLAGLDLKIRRRVVAKLEWLSNNFDRINPLSLTGEFKGFFKLRVGDWRVFYKIDWNRQMLAVCYIDHRRQAYKKR